MTLRIGFDPTQCACAYDMSNRLIMIDHSEFAMTTYARSHQLWF